MKLKPFNLKNLYRYNHLAILLFRGIELGVVSKKLSRIKTKQPSMDLGSGDGFISSILFKDKFTYGVDNNEANDSEVAIQKKRYGKVLIESAEEMSIRKNSLNFVFSNSVIEHIPNNKAVLSEVSRILKKDGLFVFTCPSKFFTSYLQESKGPFYTRTRNKMLNHYHLLGVKGWEKRLKAVGLKVVNHYYYMDKRTLLLWDKIVWINKLLTPLWFIRVPIMEIFFSRQVLYAIKKNKISKKEGANILIIAQK